MDPQTTTVEVVLTRLASRQHGVVTRVQLLGAGVTAQEIRDRVRSGALLREHRGVYRVGHRAPSIEARYLAAVFACGEDAVLSGRAAAHLYGLLKGQPPPPDVSTPLKRRARGVAVRRTRVDAQDTATYRGIPITTVPRTLIGLAADLPLDALAPLTPLPPRPGAGPPPRARRARPRGRPPALHVGDVFEEDPQTTINELKGLLTRAAAARSPPPPT